ncbi:hypothetical protein LIA77_05055 [Sarocladium implicatum]|nr:hypothetical protein LIA77_05055 [Sarocladium implicatum]
MLDELHVGERVRSRIAIVGGSRGRLLRRHDASRGLQLLALRIARVVYHIACEEEGIMLHYLVKTRHRPGMSRLGKQASQLHLVWRRLVQCVASCHEVNGNPPHKPWCCIRHVHNVRLHRPTTRYG